MTGLIDLRGQRAVVTGGAAGIGLATAKLLVECGAHVAVLDRDDAAASAAADAIGAIACAADVADAAGMSDAMAFVADRLGGITALIANAGVGSPRPASVVDLPLEEWDRLFGVNVTGAFLSARFAIPHIRAAGGGSVSFTSSAGGLTGTQGQAAYSATKAAIVSLTKSLALDHGHERIRVNCVCPGPIDTETMREITAMPGFLEMLSSAVPVGRIGAVDEVASCFAFLVSDAARYVSGHALVVDGGLLAGTHRPPPAAPTDT
jgi:NAD(P)-dependent dehydrogenase (short-subunit alcohol dehydrogenase family)